MAKKKGKAGLVIAVAALALACAGGYVLVNKMKTSPGAAPVSQADARPFTTGEIENFVAHDFLKILSFDAATDLATHMQNIAPYIADDGLDAIEDSFRRSRLLEQGLSSNPAFLSPPKVVETKGEGMVQEWKVEVPIEIEYSKNGKPTLKSKMDAKIYVVPKNDENNYLGVLQMILIPQ